MSLHHGLRSAAGASVADPYFANTSLLLLGNGSNGGQNHTFVDGSANNLTITRYGNTTQGTFSPFGYNWSNYFDGNGDYLSAPANSAFDLALSTTDFTIEAWFFSQDTSTFKCIASVWQQGAGDQWLLNTSSGTLEFYWSPYSRSVTLLTGGTVTGNAWHHVAVTRSGNTFRLFLNGSQVTSASSTGTYGTSYNLNIGYYGSGTGASPTSYFNGNISNLRILKGTAQYTSNFTPPTTPLTAITNTSILTCQSNRFIDNSSNAFSITPYGDARVTNFAPFPTNSEYSTGVNGGSGYFDGSGDYLSIADNAALEVGSGDFTLETWVYYRGPNSANGANIVSKGNSSSFGPYAIGLNPASGKVEGLCSYTGSTWNIALTSSATLPTNTWTHLAFVRSGNTFTLYLNGTSNATTTSSSSLVDNTENVLVGKTNYVNTEFPGYITDVRLVKGTAVYSGSSFTIPTAPLTAITNTSLLLNFTNASIIDSTGKNDLETVGDAQISTSVKKFGTGSLKFDGTGDRLVIPYKADLLLGSGDFTVEMWLYKNANTAYMTACGNLSTANSSAWQVLGDSTGNKIAWYSSNAFQLTSTSSLATSTWHHVAFVRNGTFFKLYLNGTEEASATNSVNFNVTNDLWIGHTPENISGRDWNGYIDDLRITKGVARYTAAFTPPSRQLPAR